MWVDLLALIISTRRHIIGRIISSIETRHGAVHFISRQSNGGAAESIHTRCIICRAASRKRFMDERALGVTIRLSAPICISVQHVNVCRPLRCALRTPLMKCTDSLCICIQSEAFCILARISDRVQSTFSRRRRQSKTCMLPISPVFCEEMMRLVFMCTAAESGKITK